MDKVLADWRERRLLSPEQASLVAEVESGRLFSVAAELRALLYLGALLVIAGVGATVKKYFLELGPAAIIGALALCIAACLAYCFSRGKPYSDGLVESPNLAFDYVLYLGCAFLGILFGYLEAHYHLLAEHWDYYLLGSSALFFWFAYRFDNRFVLLTALINAGAWFGVRFEKWNVPLFDLRTRALVFGAAALAAGRGLEVERRKKHFADSYYTLGLNVLFWALLSGVFAQGAASAYAFALAGLSAAAVYAAFQRRSFQYFLYGAVYGYIGLSWCLVRGVREFGLVSGYYLVSSTMLAAAIFYFRKLLERDA